MVGCNSTVRDGMIAVGLPALPRFACRVRFDQVSPAAISHTHPIKEYST
jgi:hypothetical protein